jgi:6-phosphogluconolactonase/glucosamine-6-phosphate isomerase/deaminase
VSTPVLQAVQGGEGRRPGLWLKTSAPQAETNLTNLTVTQINPEIIPTEEQVGRAQLEEIQRAADAKSGDVVIILLGGRGAQAMYRLVGEMARTSALDKLLGRLHVFTQDALAPLSMTNALNFVADFRRLLGEAFFSKVKSFTPMRTDVPNLEGELLGYAEKLESLGGIDLFFLGLGPEPGATSHLAYIRPGSGATSEDVAGMMPIYSSVLDHHINKFKAGGATITAADEAECRAATHIMTLGPAAILRARRIVQSIVDADTAPAKRESYRRMLETEISEDRGERAAQLDANPGLWLRLHPNVRSLILPDVLAA